MSQDLPKQSKLNPQLREKLLIESKTPLRGLRRILWTAFFGSAFIGLLIMLSRSLAGENVQANDTLIQLSAAILFGLLLWFDRNKIN